MIKDNQELITELRKEKSGDKNLIFNIVTSYLILPR